MLRHAGLLELLLVGRVDGGRLLAHELGLLNCELLVGLEADFVGLLHGLLADEGRHLLELAGDLTWGAWLAGAVDVTRVVGSCSCAGHGCSLAGEGGLPGRRRGRGLATWRAVFAFAGLCGGEEEVRAGAAGAALAVGADGAWKIDVTSHALGAAAMMRSPRPSRLKGASPCRMRAATIHGYECNLQPFRTRRETLHFSDSCINSKCLHRPRFARTRPALFACYHRLSATDQLTPAWALLRLARRYGPSA